MKSPDSTLVPGYGSPFKSGKSLTTQRGWRTTVADLSPDPTSTVPRESRVRLKLSDMTSGYMMPCANSMSK